MTPCVIFMRRFWYIKMYTVCLIDRIRILGIELECSCTWLNQGNVFTCKYKFPRKCLHSKLEPVKYQEYDWIHATCPISCQNPLDCGGIFSFSFLFYFILFFATGIPSNTLAALAHYAIRSNEREIQRCKEFVFCILVRKESSRSYYSNNNNNNNNNNWIFIQDNPSV